MDQLHDCMTIIHLHVHFNFSAKQMCMNVFGRVNG